jgi:hypothetical protein
MTTVKKVITQELIDESMSYKAYRTLVSELLEDNKGTGENHSDAILNYTKMNVQRMKRLDKKTKLNDETISVLSNLNQKQIWLTITEGWCGDAAQIVPVLNRIAETSSNVDLRFILRDRHLDVMDEFLTNGGRSIPKIIILDAETLDVLKTWGPRPQELQAFFLEERQKEDYVWSNLSKGLQLWYNKDKTQQIQSELMELI